MSWPHPIPSLVPLPHYTSLLILDMTSWSTYTRTKRYMSDLFTIAQSRIVIFRLKVQPLRPVVPGVCVAAPFAGRQRPEATTLERLAAVPAGIDSQHFILTSTYAHKAASCNECFK